MYSYVLCIKSTSFSTSRFPCLSRRWKTRLQVLTMHWWEFYSLLQSSLASLELPTIAWFCYPSRLSLSVMLENTFMQPSPAYGKIHPRLATQKRYRTTHSHLLKACITGLRCLPITYQILHTCTPISRDMPHQPIYVHNPQTMSRHVLNGFLPHLYKFLQ